MKKIIIILSLLIIASLGRADTYIPLSGDTYNHLRRLEALGYIKGGQLTILPLSLSEIRRLVKEAEENVKDDKGARRIIEKIKSELPSNNFQMQGGIGYRYIEDNRSILLNKNSNGIKTEEGSNIKLEGNVLLDSKNFSLFASPYFLSNERYEKMSLNELYGLFTYKKLEVSLGKEIQWWGGGQNGSILLSNNAEGLNVFKISNSTPIDFIIPLRFAFFITKLENNRVDVKSPYLNGIRLTLKPSKYFEIGLSKTALYGGRGRDNSLGAFFDSLIGNKEKNTTGDYNREPGDQRAGFDFKLIVPNNIQPFTFYVEAIGEDVSEDFPYPYKYAFLYSLYLPKVLSLNDLELLIEHADTVFRQRGIWYNHHIFTQGYTYNGDIIGHYIGGDAKDWFVKARYNFQNSRLNISYERLKKVVLAKVYEAFFIDYEHKILDNLSLAIEGSLLKEEKDKILIGTGIRYKF